MMMENSGPDARAWTDPLVPAPHPHPARLRIRLTLPHGAGFTLQTWRGAGC
jgi:hypothetical protein